jgi:hypothetical protein
MQLKQESLFRKTLYLMGSNLWVGVGRLCGSSKVSNLSVWGRSSRPGWSNFCFFPGAKNSFPAGPKSQEIYPGTFFWKLIATFSLSLTIHIQKWRIIIVAYIVKYKRNWNVDKFLWNYTLFSIFPCKCLYVTQFLRENLHFTVGF